MVFIVFSSKVNYHRQRRWLDILALEGALLGLVVIFYFGAFANRFIVFCTNEVTYLDLIITNHAANSISKIRSGAQNIFQFFLLILYWLAMYRTKNYKRIFAFVYKKFGYSRKRKTDAFEFNATEIYRACRRYCEDDMIGRL